MKNLTVQFITVITMALQLLGCDVQPVSQAGAGAVKVVRVESRHSSSFSAGQIQMTYKLLDQPVIDRQSRLYLKFQLPPFYNLNLSFSDNDHIELMQSYQSSYEGTKDGKVEVMILYRPVDAGKTYLKFIASTADGQKIRAFAIAVPVADQSGTVPKRKKTTKSRINLPSSNH